MQLDYDNWPQFRNDMEVKFSKWGYQCTERRDFEGDIGPTVIEWRKNNVYLQLSFHFQEVDLFMSLNPRARERWSVSTARQIVSDLGQPYEADYFDRIVDRFDQLTKEDFELLESWISGPNRHVIDTEIRKRFMAALNRDH